MGRFAPKPSFRLLVPDWIFNQHWFTVYGATTRDRNPADPRSTFRKKSHAARKGFSLLDYRLVQLPKDPTDSFHFHCGDSPVSVSLPLLPVCTSSTE